MRDLLTCALGGVGLLDLDDRIYIEDIRDDIAIDHETAKRPSYGLYPLNDPNHQSITVTVTFMVKERDRVARAAVIQKVRGWADKGWLTTNLHPDQQLYVFCTQPPPSESLKWNAKMDIKFTAYGEAYWQEIVPLSASSSSAASSATRAITPRGTQDCFLEAQIAPSSGTLTSVTITVGTQQFKLTGLSVTSAAPLLIYYDELHNLHIESGGTSLLSKRSGDSSDDIILTAGQPNTVTMTFSRACNYTIKARGLWK